MAGEEKSVFNLADEDIKLIDILAEDDVFLVTSTLCNSTADYEGFRLSGVGTSNMDHMNLDLPNPSRPSLAWDTSFYNGAGVLDPDELSFINKGLSKLQDDKRPSKSRTRHEISKTVQATMKAEKSNKNKERINVSARKRTDIIFSPKPPKSSRRINISTSSSHRGLSDVKTETKSAREDNKSATKVSSLIGSLPTRSTLSRRQTEQGKNNNNNNNKLFASFSTWKFSQGGGLGTRSVNLPTRSLALPSHSSLPSTFKNKMNNGSSRKSSPIINDHPKKASDLPSNFDNPEMDSRENQITSSAKQYGPRGVKGNGSSASGSTNNFRPSQLHPPSPNNRFFHQITPCKRHMPTSISRTSSGKVLPSNNTRNLLSAASNKKLKTRSSDVFQSSLMLKTNNHRMSKSVAIDRDLYSKSEKISLNSSLKEEKTRVALKKDRIYPDRTQDKIESVNSLSSKAVEENEKGKIASPEDYKLGNLIRFFEGIHLKDDKTPSGNGKSIEESVPFASKTRTRTPLADRNSSGNLYLH